MGTRVSKEHILVMKTLSLRKNRAEGMHFLKKKINFREKEVVRREGGGGWGDFQN